MPSIVQETGERDPHINRTLASFRRRARHCPLKSINTSGQSTETFERLLQYILQTRLGQVVRSFRPALQQQCETLAMHRTDTVESPDEVS